MILLETYNADHFAVLNNYQLSDKQANFTASVDFCINERKDFNDLMKTPVSIVYTDAGLSTPIGFFVLDRGAFITTLTDNSKALAIRSLSINPAYQGRGIGTQSMRLIPSFVRERMPNINEIVFLVNFKNIGAYHVYLKAGYVDTGRVIEDALGEQHVMSKIISKRSTSF